MNAFPDDDNRAGRDGSETPSEAYERRVVSMHENVPIWHDSCSCEAEPYWIEALGEGGCRAEDGDPSVAAEGDSKRNDRGSG